MKKLLKRKFVLVSLVTILLLAVLGIGAASAGGGGPVWNHGITPYEECDGYGITVDPQTVYVTGGKFPTRFVPISTQISGVPGGWNPVPQTDGPHAWNPSGQHNYEVKIRYQKQQLKHGTPGGRIWRNVRVVIQGPFHYKLAKPDDCYVTCSETVAQPAVYTAWYDVGSPVWSGGWVDNGDGTFTMTGLQAQQSDWTQEFMDSQDSTHLCSTDSGTLYKDVPVSKTEDGSVEVYTNATCEKAWAHYEYFDPDHVFVGKDPNVRFFWVKPFELEKVTLLGVEIFEPEKCLPEPEECGRCSNVFAGWVEWVDRDGGCDGDYNNERVEYPGDERCVNCDETVAQEPVWGDWVLGLEKYGPWQDNGDGTFTRTGTRTDTRSATVNHLDARYETIVCKVTYLGQIRREPISETDDGSEKIKTGQDCLRAWAFERVIDPGGGFVDGPKVFVYWQYPYITEETVIMGKIIHEEASCQPDIPEPPRCPEGQSVVEHAVWDAELGEWVGLVCEFICKPVPIIKYTIAGNYPCIYYGRTGRGETVKALPEWVKDQIANGGCDLLDRIGCDGVTPIEDAIWDRVESGKFTAAKITSCYVPEPCVGCDGEEVPAYNPLDNLH